MASSPMTEAGWGGADIISGAVRDRRPQLTGRNGRQNYFLMRNTEAVLVGAMSLLESMVRGVKWTVEADADTAEDAAAKEFIEGILFKDMSHTFGDFIADAITMATYGWSYFEVVYKLRGGPDQTDPALRSNFTDGRWGIRKLAFRSQFTLDHWAFDDAGGLQGMWQMAPNGKGGTPIFLPIDRCLHLSTTPAGGSPEGMSLLYGCYDTWADLQSIRRSERIAIKREMAGIPLAKVPESLMRQRTDDTSSVQDRARAEAAYQSYRRIVSQIQESEDVGFIIASDVFASDDGRPGTVPMYQLGFVPPAGQRSIDIDTVIKRYEANLMRALLMNFLNLDGGKGSYALADELVDVALGNLAYLLDRIAEMVNRHLLTKVWRLNAMPFDKKPELRHGPFRREDIDRLANYVQKTAAAGFLTPIDKPLEQHIRSSANLPDVPEDWEPPETTPIGGLPGDPTGFGGLPPPNPPPVPTPKPTPTEKAALKALRQRRKEAGAGK